MCLKTRPLCTALPTTFNQVLSPEKFCKTNITRAIDTWFCQLGLKSFELEMEYKLAQYWAGVAELVLEDGRVR